MSKCIKCGTQFVGIPEQPTSDHLCKWCEIKDLREMLRYVAHLRLPLGDTVFEHIDFERQKQIHEMLK